MLKCIILSATLMALPAHATVLSGCVAKEQDGLNNRQSPFFAVNYGGTTIPLGQELHPAIRNCSFFYIGNLIYIFRGETLMGAISDKDFVFQKAEDMMISQVLPRPDNDFAASKDEISYFLSSMQDTPFPDGDYYLKVEGGKNSGVPICKGY